MTFYWFGYLRKKLKRKFSEIILYIIIILDYSKLSDLSKKVI